MHRAVMHSGEEVVLKVQRPGLRALFDIDLTNLRKLAQLLDRGDDTRDFLGIYDECATILYKEIDYIAEGRSADRWGVWAGCRQSCCCLLLMAGDAELKGWVQQPGV